MNKKNILFTVVILLLAIVADVAVATRPVPAAQEKQQLSITLQSDSDAIVPVYFLQQGHAADAEFNNTQAVVQQYTSKDKAKTLTYDIPADTSDIRISIGDSDADTVRISEIQLSYDKEQIQTLSIENDAFSDSDQVKVSDGNLVMKPNASFITYKINPDTSLSFVRNKLGTKYLVRKILVIVAVDFILLIIWLNRKNLMAIPIETYRNRSLIVNLAKNDFKQKFAGSYLGIIWAFVQPIVTVLVYWFVFEKALNAGTQSTKAGIAVPYVLWLIAGLVPWFYFSEVLSSGTNVLYEYSYLVKKVVFDINVLPVVKVISSLFVHLFFIGFTLVMYMAYQFWPTLYMLQMIYYSFAMVVLSLGLIYLTSAIMVFFKDLSQIINIVLQIGIWMTPIMWNIDGMISRIPGWMLTILKMNPMYYIVCGYRDALINNVWFWQRPGLTLYFWGATILIFIFGTSVFRRLEVHFADVL